MNQLENRILDRLNQESSKSINKAILLRTLQLDDRDESLFFETINLMREKEVVRTERGGQGGMVCLNAPKRTSQVTVRSLFGIPDESELYPKIMDILRKVVLPELGIAQNCFVMEETATAPSRKVLGKWSCPDISIIMVKNYTFLPSSGPVMLTIEVKKNLDQIVDSVYQAKHHRRFGHYSYLYVRIPRNLSERQQTDLLNLHEHCRRELVGLATFTDADDWSTYDFRFDPIRNRMISLPDPDLLERFIYETFSAKSKFEIMRIVSASGRVEKHR